MNSKHRAALLSHVPNFFRALKRNDLHAVSILLNEGIDVDTVFHKGGIGKPALCICIENGTIEMAKLLIEYGCSVNLADGNGQTPLHFAVMYRRFELVPFLIQHRANVNSPDNGLRTPLHAACFAGDYDCYLALVEAHANVNALDLNRRTPLLYACIAGSTEIALSLLERGANINFRDCCYNSSFVYAVSLCPSYDLVKALIQHGAEVNTDNCAIIPVLCFLRGLKENFPVDISEGCRILQLLIDSGCKLNATTYGGINSLHVAVNIGIPDIVKILLDAGCPNVADGIGKTPLYYACYYKHREIVRLLIANGTNWGSETWLQNEVLKSTCKEELVLLCIEESQKLPRLCHLSRTVLRRFLSPHIAHSVNLLSCPPLIKEYIRLDHY